MTYYSVINGRDGSKIYDSWIKCKKNITGVSCCKYKKFTTYNNAEQFIHNSTTIISNNIDFIKIYTDGSLINNIGGIGIYIPEYKIAISQVLPGKKQTSQRAELYAAIQGIKFGFYISNKPICIYTDSSYVTGLHYSSKINSDLWNKLKKESCGLHITYKKIKSHSGNKYNDIADKLAKQATSI
jgi:ribonuclease HI